jgi:hypothetical protein
MSAPMLVIQVTTIRVVAAGSEDLSWLREGKT